MPKLAGIISYRLKQLETSRAKFEESWGRNPADCETGFYLGVVLGDLRVWPQASTVNTQTAACLQGSNESLREQIEKLRVSSDPPARLARQIARREQQIASKRRLRHSPKRSHPTSNSAIAPATSCPVLSSKG